ncbi:hypothetical protein BJV82DRAFT_663985 [Fennellomyces sp. T-0311]|nr:hypothetical protein BJV82DRAFT_663985 [Fennellomyces sp. T-0311]
MGKERHVYLRLHHMRFFLLSIKLSSDLDLTIRNLIKDHGHSVINSAEHADYIVTCLRSPDRISRHVKHTTPVVHTDWFTKEAMNEDQLKAHTIALKCKKRKIESPSPPPPATMKAEVIALSSEDEQQTLPRQVRSWDHLQETFAKHGCKVTPRMVIAGHRPVPTLKKEESYQTTTTTGQSTSLERFSDFNFTEADTTDDEKVKEETLNFSSQETVEKLGVYACQRQCDWNPFNKPIVELLEFLEYARELQGDPMNSRSYHIAANGYPKKIKSAAQVQKLHGIGQKTSRIIADFLKNGCVDEIELLKKDPDFKVLDTFYNVHGAGAYTAREWHRKGYRTLDDVFVNAKLSKDQKIGIKYYDDFRKKIPRIEVEEIWKSVVGILDVHFPGSQSTICGSYRRGSFESSDVDIVITHKDGSVTSSLLQRLLEILKEEKLLVEIISLGSECQLREGDDEHLRPHQALCIWKQPRSSIFRRVDLVVSPYENYPVAILAWTGSKHFERSIRLYAKKVMNIKVSSHGFYSRATQHKIPVKSERHAFEILNLKWLEPNQRNC